MKKRISILVLTLIVLFCFATPLAALNIASPSGIIIDAKDGGALYEKNADLLRPCASTTKVMSLLLIFEDLHNGKITLDTPVAISSRVNQASMRSDWSNVPLYTDRTYTVQKLLQSITVVSACGSTMAMAEHLEGSTENFAARMNKKAAELGLTAQYTDETGLSSGCKITARSLAKLSDELVTKYPEVLGYTALTSMVINGKTYYCTNKLLPGQDYAYLGADGLKTGTTTSAGKCIAGTAKRDNTRVIMVVMGAKTEDQRYTDAVKMLDFGFANALLYPLIFKDVATTAWYYDAVELAYNNGLIAGTSTYTYSPADKVTRSQFVSVLGRLWEKTNGTIPGGTNSSFSDVVNGSWYQKYVDWAESNDIVKGSGDGTFRPERTISREEMMVILNQYNTLINGTGTVDLAVLDQFEDGDQVSAWAQTSAAWCIANKIINGISAKEIAPQGTADRAQMSVVFKGYIQ